MRGDFFVKDGACEEIFSQMGDACEEIFSRTDDACKEIFPRMNDACEEIFSLTNEHLKHAKIQVKEEHARENIK